MLRRDISPISDLFGAGIVTLDLFANWIKEESDFEKPWESVLKLTPNFKGFIKKLIVRGNNSFYTADEAITELKTI